jgi:predicted ATPase/class 3 adenylate cyclase
MRSLPTGTITFLYTDIEGSTRLWQAAPSTMPLALDRHNAILTEAIEAHNGVVFRTAGDAFCSAFSRPADAVAAALAAQRGLRDEVWAEGCVLRVRMAIHSGTAEVAGGDYVGHTLNRVARLLAAGHGGQVLVSSAAEELVRDHPPRDTALLDLGEHRLKDLVRPEHIYQLCAPDLPGEFPPLATLDTRPTNLPVQPTQFIGREREVHAVAQMLQRPEVRLLTLTGPGGTGKTRLSLQAGAELFDSFADGVFFVPLSEISAPERVPAAVVEALGVKEAPGQQLEDATLAHLRDREILLILDNFEQVVDAAAFVSRLLSACPRLTILVTSRAALRISGEHEYAVPTLSVPDASNLPSPEALSQYDAVALFIDRAASVKSDFAVTNENALAVAEICARLDGLPLAIELAAARTRLFPPQALLGRLENRLKLLTGGARDLPARQQTLRGAIEWSYSLLDIEEQRLFARISVFAGGCTFESAEAVCDPDGELDIDMLDGISSLVEKSLLRQEGDEPRFAMLNTIREYAQERLREMGADEEVRRRHAEYFINQAYELHRGAVGLGNQMLDIERIRADRDNFTAALSWLIERREAQPAMTLAGYLCWYWSGQGAWNEGIAWCDRALSLSSADDRSAGRAHVLWGSGLLACVFGDFSTGLPRLEESRELFDHLGLEEEQTLALLFTGIFRSTSGDVRRGREYLERGLMQARRQGRNWIVAFALNSLAVTLAADGDLAGARAAAEESLRMLETGSAPNTTRYIHNVIGDVARTEGKYAEARDHYTSALTIAEQYGHGGFAPSLRHNLGWTLHGLGQDSEAIPYFTRAIADFRAMSDRRGVAECLVGLGCVTVATDPDVAVRLMAAGLTLLKSMQAKLSLPNRSDYDRNAATGREALGEDGWQRSWDEGSRLSAEEALALVRSGEAVAR